MFIIAGRNSRALGRSVIPSNRSEPCKSLAPDCDRLGVFFFKADLSLRFPGGRRIYAQTREYVDYTQRDFLREELV
jgi:hypothetical protein